MPLTSGQSSPDETQRVFFLQDKRRGTVTEAGVSADETRAGQRREKQEGPLRWLICSQRLPLSYWLKEQLGIKPTKDFSFLFLVLKLMIVVVKKSEGERKSVLKWTSGEKTHSFQNQQFASCLKLIFIVMVLTLRARGSCHSLKYPF